MKKSLRAELKRVVKRLVRRYKPDKIILFGSLAKGPVSEWSDIDLAIIKDTRKRFLDRLKDVLLTAMPKEGLDVVVYTPNEVLLMEKEKNPFWLNEIKSKGKILYQRS